jgi:hypothetical protein
MTSQIKQHQVKPTEFGKYGDDQEIANSIYQSPVIDKFPKSIQYCRKTKMYDKFVNVVSNKIQCPEQMNKSSHEPRRVIHPSLINSASKYKKQRNNHDFTGLREHNVRQYPANIISNKRKESYSEG